MSAPSTHAKDRHGGGLPIFKSEPNRPHERLNPNLPKMPDTTRAASESKPTKKPGLLPFEQNSISYAIVVCLEPSECAICMDECNRPKALDRCGHIFCTACIDRYFNEVKPQCPCCFVVYGEMRGRSIDRRSSFLIHFI